MQGRLLPPVEGHIQRFPGASWRDEFPLASALGIDAIEWIVDEVRDNPLLIGGKALASLEDVLRETGVQVASICADIFMEKHLLAKGSAQDQATACSILWELIERASTLGIFRIVLPFVDSSELTDTSDLMRASGAIQSALPAARAEGVELHLETSLGPSDFAAFLNHLPDPMVKVNYDMGNSAALGYRPEAEFAAYGTRIGSVHVKDRMRGGTTVALGTGSTDFDAVFAGLHELGYDGDYVLQVARGGAGDEVSTIGHSIEFVRQHLAEAAG